MDEEEKKKTTQVEAVEIAKLLAELGVDELESMAIEEEEPSLESLSASEEEKEEEEEEDDEDNSSSASASHSDNDELPLSTRDDLVYDDSEEMGQALTFSGYAGKYRTSDSLSILSLLFLSLSDCSLTNQTSPMCFSYRVSAEIRGIGFSLRTSRGR